MAWNNNADPQRDTRIAVQNALSAAATIYAAQLATSGGEFSEGDFQGIHAAVLNISLVAAGSSAAPAPVAAAPVQVPGDPTTPLATVQAAFPGAQVVNGAPPVAGGSGSFKLNFGAYKDKTLAEVAQDLSPDKNGEPKGPSYLRWAGANLNNAQTKAAIQRFLAGQ